MSNKQFSYNSPGNWESDHLAAALGVVGDVKADAAANAAATVTYAAVADRRHVISGLAWSYSGAPTGGKLTVEDGSGNEVFEVDVTSGGPGFFPFAPAKKGSVNTAMIVTLAAGGAGVTGKVSVLGHWTE